MSKKRKGVSRVIARQEDLTRMAYPHYANWQVLRHLVKPGCILLNKAGVEATVDQVIKPTIPGDTPALIIKHGEETKTTC